MINAVCSQSDHGKSPALPGAQFFVTLALAVWFVLVVSLGAAEAFVTPGERPPLALLIAATVPILVFLAASSISQPSREFVFTADLRFMTAIQAWRIGGFSFLALYLYGILPRVLRMARRRWRYDHRDHRSMDPCRPRAPAKLRREQSLDRMERVWRPGPLWSR